MKEKILQLRKEGRTYNEIKNEIGCSKGTIAYHCGEGQKEKYKASNDSRRIRNRKWIEDFKKTLVCNNCGESRWWVLDFHHTKPEEKEGAVSDLMKEASRERVIKEISKCEVLCANCHRDLHYKVE